jgi:hypothetical protein
MARVTADDTDILGELLDDESAPAEEALEDEEALDEELIEEEGLAEDEDLGGLLAEDSALIKEVDAGLVKEADLGSPERQFAMIRDLAVDVAGLVGTDRPQHAEANRLADLADEMLAGCYASALDYLRGAALAEMLTLLTSLFGLGRQIENDPALYYQSEESPLALYEHIMPQLRSCLKLVSDEIAIFARALVQTEAGVRHLLAADLADLAESPDAREQSELDHQMAVAMEQEFRAQAHAQERARTLREHMRLAQVRADENSADSADEDSADGENYEGDDGENAAADEDGSDIWAARMV